MAKHIRFAIDTGGTFTDIVVLDERTGDFRLEKVDTTPHDPLVGVMHSIHKAQVNLPTVARMFVHGTTLGLNALLQRKGARTGLITTQGFRDVLEVQRANRPEVYNYHYKKPKPLVPRRYRLEVPERVAASGEVIHKLDEDAARAVIRQLKSEGVRSIAVCLLNSYANPVHELRLQELLREEFPESVLSLSHHLSREYREYERMSTTVMDAYLKPIIGAWLGRVESELRKDGFDGETMLCRCDGGAMNFATGAENPVHAVFSGPSGGAVGSRTLADVLGRKNLIAVDMGGTSFDVSLVYGGRLQHLSSGVFAKFPVLTQVIDIRSIGAGGGSIAWIDAGGRLDVGPQSAGADPGPICYGRGGEQPTVTDAALAAGWLSPTYFLGGERTLDIDAATTGIKQKITNPLGLDLAAATAGILNIVTSKMAGAIREITEESGYDPRDFALAAFGGAGPLFATALAEELAIPTVIIPVGPGTFSAWGMLTVDLTYDLSQTYLRPLHGSELDGVTSAYERLVSKGLATLERQGVPAEKRTVECSIEMRYQGQEHSIAVPLPNYRLTAAEVGRLATRFGDSHEALYGHRLPHPAEITTLRVKAIGLIQKPQLKKVARGSGLALEAVKGTRTTVDILRRRNLASKVYERSLLKAGDTILGPAIVEEPTSCTVIYASQTCRMDDFGNLVIALEEHSAFRS